MYRLKKVFYVFVCISFIWLQPKGAAAQDVPEITADAAILVEASTGRVLYEKAADDMHYPASMTKMMTCILGLERDTPGALIGVSPEAADTESSALRLQSGDAMRFSELLQGMMLVSDNAAAVAAAEYMGGDVTSFAVMMNQKAAELGMEHSHFVNPNGLPDAEHYSTARDMAKLACYAWRNPEFRHIVGVKKQRIYWQYPQGHSTDAENTNELLGSYAGMNGIKTGYTNAAGGCFAASAARDGTDLIAVVMAAEDENGRFSDAAALLDYGFTRVRSAELIARQNAVKTVWVHSGRNYKVKVRPEQDVYVPLFDGEELKHYTVRYAVPRFMRAPVQAGDKVGSLVICYDGREVEHVDMLADMSIGKGFSLMSFLVGLYDGIYGAVFAG